MGMDQGLRRIVQVNALFSLAIGGLLAAMPDRVGEWLGVDISGWLRLLGAALVGHFVLLWWAQAQDDVSKWARLNLLAIAPYPILMIGLVVLGLVEKNSGTLLVLIDGAIVGGMAVVHWWLLRSPTEARARLIAP